VTTAPAPQVLDAFGSVVLNASGYGTVTLAPPSYQTWTVTGVSVQTDQGVTQTPVPQCTVYRGAVGGTVIAQTWMGNRSTAVGSTLVQPSQPLVIEWKNGVAGSRATVWLDGTFDMR
jgi:hypothetical protein